MQIISVQQTPFFIANVLFAYVSIHSPHDHTKKKKHAYKAFNITVKMLVFFMVYYESWRNEENELFVVGNIVPERL